MILNWAVCWCLLQLSNEQYLSEENQVEEIQNVLAVSYSLKFDKYYSLKLNRRRL